MIIYKIMKVLQLNYKYVFLIVLSIDTIVVSIIEPCQYKIKVTTNDNLQNDTSIKTNYKQLFLIVIIWGFGHGLKQ